MKPMWCVRAGRGGVYAEDFIAGGFVALGWSEAGDPTGIADKAALLARFAAAYPDRSDQTRMVWASVVFRFVGELRIGDDVVVYDPRTRLYHVGEIAGPPTWHPDAADESLFTRRAVTWRRYVRRDLLSPGSRAALGSIVTLFKVAPAAAAELRAGGEAARLAPLVTGGDPAATAGDADPFADIADLAVERIKDRIVRLGWEDMQELVAALLRAMGYRTKVSPRGADRGRDILATTDGFGFRPPRIFVEVKHRPGQAMGAPDVRAMPVGPLVDDRGLYVSTGGFTREALYEAERSKTPITLMDLDDLTRAIIDAYPDFDEAGRALLPLHRLYWPVAA